MGKLPKCIHENGMDYILLGEYYFPVLELSEESLQIGYWGRLHKEYLKEYHQARYNCLLLSDRLDAYLANLNEQAEDRLETIIHQMKVVERVDETLKATDQLCWIQKMNSIRNRAEEIIKNELIYT